MFALAESRPAVSRTNAEARLLPLSIPSRHSTWPATDLVGTFLAGVGARTRQEYRRDLEDFAAYLGEAGVDQAAQALLSKDHGAANYQGHQYRSHLMALGLAPKTINRRLTAFALPGQAGPRPGPGGVDLVPNVTAEAYRDTRGPGMPAVRAMLETLQARQDAKGKRDTALVRLLFYLTLRRNEYS
jgi:hypothetical protein